MKETDEEDLGGIEIDDAGFPGRNKIVIIGENYQLKQISDSDVHWNLYLKRFKKNGEEKWVCDAYGVTITTAIPKIINFMIAQKLNGKAVTLRQYLQIWAKVSLAVRKELKGL